MIKECQLALHLASYLHLYACTGLDHVDKLHMTCNNSRTEIWGAQVPWGSLLAMPLSTLQPSSPTISGGNHVWDKKNSLSISSMVIAGNCLCKHSYQAAATVEGRKIAWVGCHLETYVLNSFHQTRIPLFTYQYHYLEQLARLVSCN